MTENKQLYEKQSNQYNPFFPIVRLDDIIETISDKSIQWILNNYNHIYVEYSESVAITRNKVPSLLRRNGLWISYNTGTEIITEFYKGKNVDINKFADWTADINWEKYNTIKDGTITYQHLSAALKQMINENEYYITNFPDEEDITTDGTVLSFKNRNYEPDNFSGLGKVIIRKNIILVDGVYKNVLTQDMINKSNTIYEIRYDFDLNGNEITIPEECVLDFQGGCLGNGTIVGNNTVIKAELVKIFGLDINLSGSWNISEVYPEWFGAKGDGKKNNSKEIQASLKFSEQILSSLVFQPNIYIIDEPIIITKGEHTINGNGCSLVKTTSTIANVPSSSESFGGQVNVQVSAIFVSPNRIIKLTLKRFNLISEEGADVDGIVFAYGNNCEISDIHSNYLRHGMTFYNLWMSKIDRCRLNNSGIGFYYNYNRLDNSKIQSATSNVITNCYANVADIGFLFEGVSYTTLNSCAVDHSNVAYNIIESRLSMNGCGAEDTKQMILNVDSNSSIVVSSMETYDTEDNPNYNYINISNSKVSILNSYFRCPRSYLLKASNYSAVNYIDNYVTDGQTASEGNIRTDETSDILYKNGGTLRNYNNVGVIPISISPVNVKSIGYSTSYIFSQSELVIGYMSSESVNSITIPISKIQELLPEFHSTDGYTDLPINLSIYRSDNYAIGYIVSFPINKAPILKNDNVITNGNWSIESVSADNENIIVTFNQTNNYFKIRIRIA